MKRLLRFRKMTWALIAWVLLILLFSRYVVALVGFIGLVVLSVIWLATEPRDKDLEESRAKDPDQV